MAKILDKMFNRVIDGEILEITEEEKQKLGLGKTKLYLHKFELVTDVIHILTNSPLKPSLEDGTELEVDASYDDDSKIWVLGIYYYDDSNSKSLQLTSIKIVNDLANGYFNNSNVVKDADWSSAIEYSRVDL